MNNFLKIENLTYSYNKDKNVLKNLSLNIEKGKITTIIGENGSGKSTLFNLLSKQKKDYSGEIILKNKNLKKYNRKELAKNIAFVYQKNKAVDELSVYDLISYGRIAHKKNLFSTGNSEEDIKKINFAIQSMQLDSLKNELVSNLSGGQLQRVFIALALAQDTDILMLDEPTVYLDIKYQKMIMDLLVNLNKKYKITIVMILHDINQAVKYSDNIFILKKGKVINDGSIDSLFSSNILEDTFETKLNTLNNIFITW